MLLGHVTTQKRHFFCSTIPPSCSHSCRNFLIIQEQWSILEQTFGLHALVSEAFCTFMRPLRYWWIAYAAILCRFSHVYVLAKANRRDESAQVLVAADYLFGVVLSVEKIMFPSRSSWRR